MPITIECYKTLDGHIFECEDKAQAHTDDLLGAELDGLFLLANTDISRKTQYKALLRLIDRKDELRRVIDAIHAILHHGE